MSCTGSSSHEEVAVQMERTLIAWGIVIFVPREVSHHQCSVESGAVCDVPKLRQARRAFHVPTRRQTRDEAIDEAAGLRKGSSKGTHD